MAVAPILPQTLNSSTKMSFSPASSTFANLAFRSRVSFRTGAVSAQRLILGNQLSRGSTEISLTKTTADENLVSVLESEIKCVVNEEAPDDNLLEDKPEWFPFEIIDTPGERAVLLQRKFEDEDIQVKVDTDEEEESSGKIRIGMFVTVKKGDGVYLEFGVSAYPGEIVIDSVSIKQPQGSQNVLGYEGLEFDQIDENLQKAFHKFLEIRGIERSFTYFLPDFMANEDSREYLQWLKGIKTLVEK